MVVVETVGVGQGETEIADVADTVAVVVQPGSGDVLQFLKSGITEIPDVLVVTKADLSQIAMRTTRDLTAALRSLGSSSTPVLAVSSLPPPSGIEELVAALAEHRAGLDIPARRLRARRAGALTDFVVEHGERGLRTLGGRRAAEALLGEQRADLQAPALVAVLEQAMADRDSTGLRQAAEDETRSADDVRGLRRSRARSPVRSAPSTSAPRSRSGRSRSRPRPST